MKKSLILAVFMSLITVGLWSLDVGDRVLANYSGDSYWYPGTIVDEGSGEFQIVYDDFDREWLDQSLVIPENLEAGDRVYTRWLGGGTYYPGYIHERQGNAIWVKYDDGDEEYTTIAHVRVE